MGEDNATNQKVISKILEFSGHIVNIVENGEDVLDALEVNDYDLIIMDLHMPVMGGFEAAKIYGFTCSQDEKTPIIILTADATVESENNAKEAGVDAYLTKPIDTQKLLSTIFALTKNATSKAHDTQTPGDIRDVLEVQNTDILDTSMLKDLAELSRDIDFMSDLIHGFLDDAKKIIEQLTSTPDSLSIQDMQDSLHALKGSSRSIGATSLASHAAAMHRDLDIFDQNKLMENLSILQQTYDHTRAALLDHLNKLDSAAL